MVEFLPVQKISGRLYFLDDRLGEYRAVDNPDIRFRIKDYDMMLALEAIEEQHPDKFSYTILPTDDELVALDEDEDDEIV